MNDFTAERLIQAWNGVETGHGERRDFRDFVKSIVARTPPNERGKWRTPLVRAALVLDRGDPRTAARRFHERMKTLAAHIYGEFIDVNTIDGVLMAAIVVTGKVPARSTMCGDLAGA